MATPLKIKDGSGNIQELTTSEENYIAYQIGLHLSEADSSEVGSINKSASGTNIGTFTNTFFNEPVGTHPSTSITSGSTNTSLYQTTGTAAETDSDVYSPLMWVDSASQTGFKMMPDADLNSAIDRYLSTIFTNEYPGSFRLAVSSPGAGWVLDQQAFTDTRTDGTSVTYNIWKKTSGTSPTAVRPMRLKDEGSFDGVQEMSDRQIKYSFGQRAKTRIANSKIGTYQLRSSAQGVPTDPGTWVAKGSATDTKQTTSQQIFTRDSTTAFQTNYTRGYTSTFTLPYLKVYTRVDTAQFNQPYTSTFESPTAYTSTTAVPYDIGYIRSYTPNYTRNYTGTYTGSYSAPGYSPTFEAQYNKEFTARFTANYLKTYTTTYLNQFESNYTSNYTSNYQGTYTNSFNTNYVGTYQSNYTNNYTVTYAGTYDRQYTRGYQSEYTKRYTGTYNTNYLKTYTNNYTGLYTTRYSGGQFTDTYIGNYTNVYSKAYTDNYTKAYTTNYTLQYTQSYTGTYTSNYTLPYTLNYIGTYAGTYSTSFTGNYTKRYTGTYTGEYTGQYNVNVSYASLFNRAYVGQYLKEYTRTVYNNAYDGAIYSSTNYVRDYSNTFLRYYTVGSFAGTYTGTYTALVGYIPSPQTGYTGDYIPSYTGSGPTNYTNAYAAGFRGADTPNRLGFTGPLAGIGIAYLAGSYDGPELYIDLTPHKYTPGDTGANYTSDGIGPNYVSPGFISYTGAVRFRQYASQSYIGVPLTQGYVLEYSGLDVAAYNTFYVGTYTGPPLSYIGLASYATYANLTGYTGFNLGQEYNTELYLQNYLAFTRDAYSAPAFFYYTGSPLTQDIDIGFTQYIRDYGGYTLGTIYFYIGGYNPGPVSAYTGSFYAADQTRYAGNTYSLTFGGFGVSYYGAGNYLGSPFYYGADQYLKRLYTGSTTQFYESANSTGTGAVAFSTTNVVYDGSRIYSGLSPSGNYDGFREPLYSELGIRYISSGFQSTYYTSLGIDVKYEGTASFGSSITTYSANTNRVLQYAGSVYGTDILISYASGKASSGFFGQVGYERPSNYGGPIGVDYTQFFNGFARTPQNYTPVTGFYNTQYSVEGAPLNYTGSYIGGVSYTANPYTEFYIGPTIGFFGGSARSGFYTISYTPNYGLILDYTTGIYTGIEVSYYTATYALTYVGGLAVYNALKFYSAGTEYLGQEVYAQVYDTVVPGGVFAGIGNYAGGYLGPSPSGLDFYGGIYTSPKGYINTRYSNELSFTSGGSTIPTADLQVEYVPDTVYATAYTATGGDVSYTGSAGFTTRYIANYLQDVSYDRVAFLTYYVAPNYTKNYDVTYLKDYLGSYTGTYITNYTLNFNSNYSTNYTNSYEGQYTDAFNTQYGTTYASVSSLNFDTQYANNYTGGYTGANFETSYVAPQFIGSYQNEFNSTAYDTAYVRNIDAVAYITDYIGAPFVAFYDTTYTSTTSLTYTGSYDRTYTGNRAIAYSNDYANEFVSPYDTTYTKDVYVNAYTNLYERDFQGPSFATSYVGPVYTENYTNTYTSAYQGGSFATSYVKDTYAGTYDASYTNFFVSSYSKQYTEVYTNQYTNQYTSPQYVPNYTGIQETVYDRSYTGGNYDIDYVKSYSKDYTGNYTGSYDITYLGSYQQDYVSFYENQYTTNYTTVYETQYLTDYIGNYEGSFEGTTIDETSDTEETYTLYVRIA